MSEGGEKTENPTPKKLRDARNKGQVARSQSSPPRSRLRCHRPGWMVGSIYYQQIVGMMDTVAQLAANMDGHSKTTMNSAVTIVYKIGPESCFRSSGVTIFVGIAANYIQFGSVFSLENIMPKLEKISPGAGFKRIFSVKQLIETLKSILKIIFLSVLLYIRHQHDDRPYITAVYCGMDCLMQVTVHSLQLVFAYSALAFVVVAIADFAYQNTPSSRADDVQG